MAQFLYPDGTISSTFTTGDHTALDEGATPNDGDAVVSADNTTQSITVSLSNPAATPASGTCTLRYRQSQADGGVFPSSGGSASTLNVVFLQGGVTIAETTAFNTSEGSILQGTLTFSSDLITDWTDVRVQLQAVGGGGSPANRRGVAVTWLELEIPDGAVTLIIPTQFLFI